jgi:hypothetical protein
MIISIINLSEGALGDARLQKAIRAVNRQLKEDFEPYWGFGAQLRLEGKTGRKKSFDATDMRGDAILYVRQRVRASQDAGYHDKHYSGIPYGFVYLDLAVALDESWTITLSHEALELVGDPSANLLVQGPHPTEKRQVFHWFEMCDAVQDECYEIDGEQVSNFVLPLYFTASTERGSRNDFLGTMKHGESLKSFGANPGGYVGFFDPKIRKDDTWETDERARQRLAIKKKLRTGRGQRRRKASPRV